jgi:hypothetical protein
VRKIVCVGGPLDGQHRKRAACKPLITTFVNVEGQPYAVRYVVRTFALGGGTFRFAHPLGMDVDEALARLFEGYWPKKYRECLICGLDGTMPHCSGSPAEDMV